MNICFLSGGYTGIGGIGRVTSTLANKLSKDDNIKVYTLSYFKNNKEDNYILDNEIKKKYLFPSPINMAKGMLRGGVFKLRRFLKENEIDVLVACGTLYFPLAVSSTKGIKTKTICWDHTNFSNNKDHPFQKISRYLGAKYGDYIITLTEDDKENYKRNYILKNIENIYNPVDNKMLLNERKYRNDSKKIISVGRLTYSKNFSLLIDIANEVLKSEKEWTWDIYGEGELEHEIQKKIDSYSLGDYVKLKGAVHNLYEIYPDYAFMVMTSRYEGFGMVLVEAMANGLPLVSFDAPSGPKEIIKEGENGFLIEPFNIQAMISKIELLIKEENLRISLSKKSKELLCPFRIEQIIVQWSKVFEELMPEKD